MAQKKITAKLVRIISGLLITGMTTGVFFFNPIAKKTDLLKLDEVKTTVADIGGNNAYADYSQQYVALNSAHRFYAEANEPINVNVLIKNLTDEEKQTIRSTVDELFSIAHAINPDYTYELHFIDEQEISIIDKMTNCINIVEKDKESLRSLFHDLFIKGDYNSKGTITIGQNRDVRQIVTDDGICSTNSLIKLSSHLESDYAYTHVLKHELLHALCGLGDAYMLEDDVASVMNGASNLSYNDVVLMCAKLQKEGSTINPDEIYKMTDTYKSIVQVLDVDVIKERISKDSGVAVEDVLLTEPFDVYNSEISIYSTDSATNEVNTAECEQTYVENGILHEVTITTSKDGETEFVDNKAKLVEITDNVYTANEAYFVFSGGEMYRFGVDKYSNEVGHLIKIENNISKVELDNTQKCAKSYDWMVENSDIMQRLKLSNINNLLVSNGETQSSSIEAVKDGYYKLGDIYVLFEDGKETVYKYAGKTTSQPLVLPNGALQSAYGIYFMANGTLYKLLNNSNDIEKYEGMTEEEFVEVRGDEARYTSFCGPMLNQ